MVHLAMLPVLEAVATRGSSSIPYSMQIPSSSPVAVVELPTTAVAEMPALEEVLTAKMVTAEPREVHKPLVGMRLLAEFQAANSKEAMVTPVGA